MRCLSLACVLAVIALPAAIPAAAAATVSQYIIGTVAGRGIVPWGYENKAARTAFLVVPRRAALDRQGNTYVSDVYYNRVFKIDLAGTISTVAGSGEVGFAGDGGPATAAKLNQPRGLAFDSAGNLYIADSANSRVRRVSPSGTIATYAGSGTAGPSGDGGPAAQARVSGPDGLFIDAADNLYIAETSGNRVRMITPKGTISTIAGTGDPGFSGDGDVAVAARVTSPSGVVADAANNIFIADFGNNRIRRIAAGGKISTYAGNGTCNSCGDAGPATSAGLLEPMAVALDSKGNLYIADYGNSAVRMVTPAGIISTVAGRGSKFDVPDLSPAATTKMLGVGDVVFTPAGGLLVIETAGRRAGRIAADGLFSTLAGAPQGFGAGDGGQAPDAYFIDPSATAADAFGNLWVSDIGDYRIRKINASGQIATIAGTGVFGQSPNGQALGSQISQPQGLVLDHAGNLLFTDNTQIRSISPSGAMTTIVGAPGSVGFGGDGGPATSALIYFPYSLATDAQGVLYIADTYNNRIRRVGLDGKIGTLAGTGDLGFSGDSGAAILATLNHPEGVAVDASGNVFIADTGNYRVRKVSTAGVMTTVAGTGTNTSSGDGGPAAAAAISSPASLAFDLQGNLLVATNGRIRRIDTTGYISTIAGSGSQGFSGDGDLGTVANMTWTSGLSVDPNGVIYFVDRSNQRVRRLTPADITPAGVLNAGSYTRGGVAPGEFVTLFGLNLGPAALLIAAAGPDNRFPTTVSGVQVLFNDTPAPIYYVSATQTSVIVPYEIAGAATCTLKVVYQGHVTNTITLDVVDAAPSIFTANASGKGQGSILNQDYSRNTTATPAAAGSGIMIFGTGEGSTNPGGIDGQLAMGVYPAPVLPVSALLDGQPVQVLYAGAAPGLVAGVLQVNVLIPGSTSSGAHTIRIKVGDKLSPDGVTVAVR